MKLTSPVGEKKVFVFSNKCMQKTAALHPRNKYPGHII